MNQGVLVGFLVGAHARVGARSPVAGVQEAADPSVLLSSLTFQSLCPSLSVNKNIFKGRKKNPPEPTRVPDTASAHNLRLVSDSPTIQLCTDLCRRLMFTPSTSSHLTARISNIPGNVTDKTKRTAPPKKNKNKKRLGTEGQEQNRDEQCSALAVPGGGRGAGPGRDCQASMWPPVRGASSGHTPRRKPEAGGKQTGRRGPPVPRGRTLRCPARNHRNLGFRGGWGLGHPALQQAHPGCPCGTGGLRRAPGRTCRDATGRGARGRGEGKAGAQGGRGAAGAHCNGTGNGAPDPAAGRARGVPCPRGVTLRISAETRPPGAGQGAEP